jgi:hypothetical protein
MIDNLIRFSFTEKEQEDIIEAGRAKRFKAWNDLR